MTVRSLLSRFRARWFSVTAISFAAAINEAAFIVLLTSLAGSLVSTNDLESELFGLTLSGNVAFLVAGVLLLAKFVLASTAVWLAARLGEEVTYRTRAGVMRAYLEASWNEQQREPRGRLQELLTTFVDRVNTAMTGLTNILTGACSLAAFLAAGALVNGSATLGAVGILGVLALIILPVRRHLRRLAVDLATSGIRFARAVSEVVALSLEIRVFGVTDKFSDRLDRRSADNARSKRRVQVLTALLPQVFVSLGYAAVVIGLVVMSELGVGRLASLGAVMLLMLRSLSYAQQLMSGVSIVSGAVPFLTQLGEFIDRYSGSSGSNGTMVPPGPFGVRLDSVYFQYGHGPFILSNASCVVEPGERLGVVGPSGGGKSTLIQLILGVRSPTQGMVSIGSVDIDQISNQWLTDRTGFVPQDAVLLDGTVRENVGFMRQVSDTEVEDALRDANLHETVMKMPNGLDTLLGSRGLTLSGGQRQRLAIARALVTKPSLLVMDEPTSALDNDSEAAVRDALSRLSRATTVIIVAHRPSTLEFCDRLVEVNGGRVADVSSTATLEALENTE